MGRVDPVAHRPQDRNRASPKGSMGRPFEAQDKSRRTSPMPVHGGVKTEDKTGEEKSGYVRGAP